MDNDGDDDDDDDNDDDDDYDDNEVPRDVYISKLSCSYKKSDKYVHAFELKSS